MARPKASPPPTPPVYGHADLAAYRMMEALVKLLETGDPTYDQLFDLMGRIEVTFNNNNGFLAAMTKDGYVLCFPLVLKSMKLLHNLSNK